MARARNIKPSIMDNEDLAEFEPLTRLLFIYLWMLADREGRLEDRPKRIAAQALAYDRQADVNAMLDSLHAGGFILRYKANGLDLIQIVAFEKHQNPHIREAASELPPPKQGTTKARAKHNLGSAREQPTPERAGLIPDSGFLIPDSLIPEQRDSGAAPIALLPPPPAYLGDANEAQIPAKGRVVLSPQWELPTAWGEDAERLGFTPVEILHQAEKFRQYWVSGKGAGTRRTLKGWRQAWSNWLGNAERFRRAA